MAEKINIVIADKNFDTKVLNGLVVKSEVNANTIEIEFPKIYEGENLENKIFVIKTINANGVYFEEILPKTISENKIILKWKIGSEYTSTSGVLRVAIFAQGTNYVLGTKTSKIIVEGSPQFTASISPEYVFEKYLKEIRVHAESASNAAEQSLKILTNMNSKIVDDFASTEKDKALSANKGRELNNRINNIVGQAGTSNTEIVDARYSPERNVTYPTLKGRLDAVDGDIAKSKYSPPVTATAPIISLPSTAVKGKMEGSLKGKTFVNLLGEPVQKVTEIKFSDISVEEGAYYALIYQVKWVSGRAAWTGDLSGLANGLNSGLYVLKKQMTSNKFTAKTYSYTTPVNLTFSSQRLVKITKEEFDLADNWQALDYKYGFFNFMESTKPSKVKLVGKNLFDKNNIEINRYFRSDNGAGDTSPNYAASNYVSIEPNTSYSVNRSTLGSTAGYVFYDSDQTIISTTRANIFTTPSNAKYARFSVSKDEIESFQLAKASTVLPYEPYQETELFCPEELGSVPNGTADEFGFDGIYTQRTKETNVDLTAIADQSNVAMAFTSSFTDNSPFVRPINPNIVVGGKEQIAYVSSGQVDDIANIGKYYTMDNQRLYFIFAKGTTLEQAKLALAGTKARYQIANPIETQYPASNLISEPSGTVYVESAIKVVKPYTTNIVLDVKIKNLTSISKVEGETRSPILLSLVNVAADGMSLTILNASSGDMYELEYETFGATLPTMEYSYPLNLNAQVQGNTEGLKDIDQTLKDFLAYQNAVNAQVDLRLVLLERK